MQVIMQKLHCVLFSIFLTVLLSSSVVAGRRVDCTRFVFAPACRGIVAKRHEQISEETEFHRTQKGPQQRVRASGIGGGKLVDLDTDYDENGQLNDVIRDNSLSPPSYRYPLGLRQSSVKTDQELREVRGELSKLLNLLLKRYDKARN